MFGCLALLLPVLSALATPTVFVPASMDPPTLDPFIIGPVDAPPLLSSDSTTSQEVTQTAPEIKIPPVTLPPVQFPVIVDTSYNLPPTPAVQQIIDSMNPAPEEERESAARIAEAAKYISN